MMSVDVEIPKDLYFTEEHEWVRVENSEVRIGISDYAQEQLGDVIYAELPEVGKEFEQVVKSGSGESELATLESLKTVSAVYAPVSGEVKEANEKLEDEPEIINADPYGEGWICVVEPRELEEELKNLMDSKAYEEFLESVE
ncbi:glycine cleavage system protein H [candidate division MSBL1 archaeon SCGC-AAA382M17]|uniref:Probable glycine cleavage system H protein n=1 Tax=candidate division MSBL1 archaeon SCGC-AAA382M17 TaxID=1698284 RepID=A0ABR5TJN3_9EURY|nr:glycine cleavage system protein H [candidate division MSBL1 archaeon SCGC-AAA382M17]